MPEWVAAGFILVLVALVTAWLLWSLHRGTARPPARTESGEDPALAGRLSAALWQRLAEVRNPAAQLLLKSRLQSSSGASPSEQLVLLQEVLIDLERLIGEAALPENAGAPAAPSEVLAFLRAPQDERPGLVAAAILRTFETNVRAAMGARGAESFLRCLGTLPATPAQWSRLVETGELRDAIDLLIAASREGLGPQAIRLFLEQSAQSVGRTLPLASFPKILAAFPSDLLVAEREAALARETLWHELKPETQETTPRFGPYVLRQMLAEGGMAQVFLAEDTMNDSGRVVVLKRVLPHIGQRPEFREVFLREARIASRLVHPNVVRVFDFGELDGVCYVAMEHLPGKTLRSIARIAKRRKEPVPVAIVRDIMLGALDGLHHAHEYAEDGARFGLVHGDVSPSNIMATYQGVVKLMDFGVARALDRRRVAWVVTGDIAYSSPEQLRGEPMDRRSDLFSLGAVAFEILTGRKPFARATEAEMLQAILASGVERPSNIRADVPEPLGSVLERALHKRKEERYQTALEMRLDLEGLPALPPARIEDYLVRAFPEEPPSPRGIPSWA